MCRRVRPCLDLNRDSTWDPKSDDASPLGDGFFVPHHWHGAWAGLCPQHQGQCLAKAGTQPPLSNEQSAGV